VFLKGGETLTGKGIISYPKIFGNTDECKCRAMICLNGRKILPVETDSVIANFLTGYPIDTLWSFRVVDGRISIFAKGPNNRPCDYIAIQKGNAEIQQLTERVLRNELSDFKLALLCIQNVGEYIGDFARAIALYNNRNAAYSNEIDSLYRYIVKHPNQSSDQKTLLIKCFYKAIKTSISDSMVQASDMIKNPTIKIQLLEDAINQDSTNSDAYERVGNIALQDGASEKAINYYTKCLRYSEDEKQIKIVRKKIIALKGEPMY
jgi:tetratricopeptide (TPR) repeat protein